MTPILTTILHCTTCGRVVEDEDFQGNLARLRQTAFDSRMLPVEPVKCQNCRSPFYLKSKVTP